MRMQSKSPIDILDSSNENFEVAINISLTSQPIKLDYL